MTYIKRSVDNYERLVANLPSVFCQKDSKWEYIDDRFKSHYGSTFEIPTSEYTTRNNISGTLAVVCDKYVLIDKVQFPEYSEDNSLEDYLVMNLGEPVDYVSFVDVLTTTFHNLTIDVVGNYSSTATIYNTLDDVLNYLAIHTPQYLIFNGVEGSLLSGLSFDDCIQKLNQINSICIDNSINALFLFTPNYDIMNIDKSKFNERQLKNLDYFLDCAEKVFEDEQEALFNSEASFAICKQGINKDIVKLQSTIIKKCPYIFDAIVSNFDRKMYADAMMNFDVSETLSQSLVYVYNDKLAHKLVKSYLNVINNDPATADICGYMNQMVSIYIYTDFEFTKEELQEFIGNNNKDTIQLYNLMKKNKKEYKEYMTEEEKQF